MRLQGKAIGVLLANLKVKPLLLEQIQEAQNVDEELARKVHRHKKGEANESKVWDDSILEFQGRVSVPRDLKLR